MISWLKKYFVPHKGNDFKPHFFRSDAVIFATTILGFLFLLFAVSSRYLVRSDYFAAIYPQVLVADANEARKIISHREALRASAVLAEAARMKAEDMARSGYFAHMSPDGKTPWYWLDRAGYNFKYAGENLAVNFVDSVEIHNAWLASPSHRENILNPKFKEIGVAVAAGKYDGKEAIFVVQFFGTPAVESLPLVAEKAEEVLLRNKSEPMAVSVPEALEKQIAGASQEKIVSFWDNLVASPKTGLVAIYSLFIISLLSFIFAAALFESRRHHISIWANGFILLAITVFLIAATIYFEIGAPGIV